jgi:hypothetical protein
MSAIDEDDGRTQSAAGHKQYTAADCRHSKVGSSLQGAAGKVIGNWHAQLLLMILRKPHTQHDTHPEPQPAPSDHTSTYFKTDGAVI